MAKTNEAMLSIPFQAEVSLDGLPVSVSSVSTCHEAFILLERIALMRNRIPTSISVDGRRMEWEALEEVTSFQRLEVSSAELGELGVDIVRIASRDLAALLKRVETAQILVLINDWRVAEQLWDGLVPLFKRPMVQLSYLWQFWGDVMGTVIIDGRNLVQHWDAIGKIQSLVELVLLRQEDLMAFSDLLEREMVPWLRRLAEYLDELNALSEKGV